MKKIIDGLKCRGGGANFMAIEITTLALAKKYVESTLQNAGALKGDPGLDGKSAYQYAQDGGYTGTEEEFAQKLAKEIKVDSELSEESENPVQNKVVAQKFSQLSDTVNDHKGNANIHVTSEEKQAWNNKSDFSGSYNDLKDKPIIPEGADLTGYAKESFVKEYAQPKGEYLTPSNLSDAVNTALEQAKASGEFNGKDGQDGKDGLDGKTPQKGTDYFTEADKQAFVTDVINALPTWQGGAY